LINKIIVSCADYVTETQPLKNALILFLSQYYITEKQEEKALALSTEEENVKVAKQFILSKKVEGCSEKTLRAYWSEIGRFFTKIQRHYSQVTANDIRAYIALMTLERNWSLSYQDTVLRYLRSLFGWLTAEEYIPYNPTLKIKKIRSEKLVKKAFSEEEVEVLRRAVDNPRDLALIDTMLSTGCRVGEIVGMNINQINDDEIIVTGKGNKQRMVYLNATARVSIKKYLETRTDDNPALFVSLNEPHKRLEISGVETSIRDLGEKAGVLNCHPHKFRRTSATKALRRGMSIEQVQKMLGHANIETTLIYARSDVEDIKQVHKKVM
jgi:site-specific recombinase XerD